MMLDDIRCYFHIYGQINETKKMTKHKIDQLLGHIVLVQDVLCIE